MSEYYGELRKCYAKIDELEALIGKTVKVTLNTGDQHIEHTEPPSLKKFIAFYVQGNPLPKQSFRFSKSGSYTEDRVKAWQQLVGYGALEAMRDTEKLTGRIEVWITFWRENYIKADVDNLSKAVLDAIKGIAFDDDDQVTELHLFKRIDKKNPGCRVRITTAMEQNICEV